MCHVNWQMESFRVSSCLYGKSRISVEPSYPSLSGKICEGAGAGRLDSSIHVKLHMIQFISLVKRCPWVFRGVHCPDLSALRETLQSVLHCPNSPIPPVKSYLP